MFSNILIILLKKTVCVSALRKMFEENSQFLQTVATYKWNKMNVVIYTLQDKWECFTAQCAVLD